MNSATKWLGLAAIGAVGFFALRTLVAWREDVRIETLTAHTLANNPAVEQNEARMALAAERAWPDDAEDSAASAEQVERSVVPTILTQEADADWNSLERTNWAIEDGLADLTTCLARKMFRSRRLNPGDIYIEQPVRDRFEQLVKTQVERVQHLVTTLETVGSQEFDFMVQRGTTHRLSYADYDRSLDEATRARMVQSKERARRKLLDSGLEEAAVNEAMASYITYDPALVCEGAFRIRTGDGNFSWAHLKEMPQSKQAAELYVAGALDLCYQVLEFFTTRAGLSRLDAEKAVGAVHAHLARFKP